MRGRILSPSGSQGSGSWCQAFRFWATFRSCFCDDCLWIFVSLFVDVTGSAFGARLDDATTTVGLRTDAALLVGRCHSSAGQACQ
eukprot:4528391-Pyramimonas_sp.AAC.1